MRKSRHFAKATLCKCEVHTRDFVDDHGYYAFTRVVFVICHWPGHATEFCILSDGCGLA